jgi:secreted trypsin-like serine protease
MVSLQHKAGSSHFCGASLVAKKWVLTAAHCAQGEKAGDLQVMIGSHALDAPGTVVQVKKVIVHEKYQTDDRFDVALLKLAQNAPGTPIRIATPQEKDAWKPGTPARVIGWGAAIFAVGPGSNDLQEVDVPVVSDSDCATTNGPFGFDAETMICAGETTGGKDSCQGDSGGPLMVPDAKGDWVQMGVVSWGIGCGFPGLYGVYARAGEGTLNAWLTTHLPHSS